MLVVCFVRNVNHAFCMRICEIGAGVGGRRRERGGMRGEMKRRRMCGEIVDGSRDKGDENESNSDCGDKKWKIVGN